MTPKQSVFVDEYVKDGNASQAAVRAGLSAQHGRRLLQNATVCAAIEAKRGKLSERAEITAAAVLQKLWDIGTEAHADKAYGPATAAFTQVGKHLGMFVERHDVRVLHAEIQAAASELGVDPDELMQETQRLLGGK